MKKSFLGSLNSFFVIILFPLAIYGAEVPMTAALVAWMIQQQNLIITQEEGLQRIQLSLPLQSPNYNNDAPPAYFDERSESNLVTSQPTGPENFLESKPTQEGVMFDQQLTAQATIKKNKSAHCCGYPAAFLDWRSNQTTCRGGAGCCKFLFYIGCCCCCSQSQESAHEKIVSCSCFVILKDKQVFSGHLSRNLKNERKSGNMVGGGNIIG